MNSTELVRKQRNLGFQLSFSAEECKLIDVEFGCYLGLSNVTICLLRDNVIIQPLAQSPINYMHNQLIQINIALYMHTFD